MVPSNNIAAAGTSCTQVENNNIKILQLNLNKAHTAQVELLNKLNKLETYIVLASEPYCYKQKLSLRPKKAATIPNLREDRPRAAIFSSTHLNLSEISDLCTRDLAVAIFSRQHKTIMVISAYCDINLDPINENIKQALAYAKQRGYSVLMAADTNAHSVLWGKETNRRGQEVEDFISTENLTVHNIGRCDNEL